MSIPQMKEWLKKARPTKNWAEKVDKMPDNQVVAVYTRFQSYHLVRK